VVHLGHRRSERRLIALVTWRRQVVESTVFSYFNPVKPKLTLRMELVDELTLRCASWKLPLGLSIHLDLLFSLKIGGAVWRSELLLFMFKICLGS